MSHRRIAAIVAACLLVSVSLFVAVPAHAADIPVTSPDDDGPDTLRQALAAANGVSGQDVIIIDPGVGTITLSSPLVVTDGVIVRGNGATVTRDDSFDMVVIDLVAPGAVQLDSLNLRADASTSGSAVHATSASPDSLTISDSSFTGFDGNSSATGVDPNPAAAVRLDEGQLTVSGSVFEANGSWGGGGAISVGTITEDSTVTGSTFSDNYSRAPGGRGGSALAVGTIAPDASLNVFQSYFVGNGAPANYIIGFRGVAIYAGVVQGELVVDSSTFDHQYLIRGDRGPGPLSGWSVGVARVASGGSVHVVNSTFDELAIGDSVPIFVLSAGTVENGASFTVDHSTVVGGGSLVIDSNEGLTEVRNTIAEGLVAQDAIVVRSGSPVQVRFSALSTTMNLLYVVDGGGNQFDVEDMLLQPLADNGGPTPTMMIGPVGPAVGTGMPVALASEPTLEQRGAGYLRRMGLLDIGAVELPGELPTLPFPDPPTTPAGPPTLAATGAPDQTPSLVLLGGMLLLGGVFVVRLQRRAAASSSGDVTGSRQTKSSHK